MKPPALTPDEKRAVASLKRLAKRWPKTLWVFCGDGFTVVKCGPDGERVMRGDTVDGEMKVAHIDIPCDGGDW